jgi:hypothetical protein
VQTSQYWKRANVHHGSRETQLKLEENYKNLLAGFDSAPVAQS